MSTDTTTDQTCTDCGTTDDLIDCGEDYGFICTDCGADRWDRLMSNP